MTYSVGTDVGVVAQRAVLVAVLLSLVACSDHAKVAGSTVAVPLPAMTRPTAPRDVSMFARPSNAEAATQRFNGTLRFDPAIGESSIAVLIDPDRYAVAGQAPDYRDLPAFQMSFVQAGDRIVPRSRGPIEATDNFWEWQAEPGYVWEEPGTPGVSRAVVPVALKLSGWSCTFNGGLTFLYREPAQVSAVQWQMSQETCANFKVDIVGQTSATFVRDEQPASNDGADAFRTELAARMPTQPLGELAKKYPGVDPGAFGSAQDLKTTDLTLFGVVAEGIHYVSACGTRHGNFPFCDDVIFPSYSVAKTLQTALGMMRLEMTHPDVARQPIGPLVPECAREGHWNDITIENALDMATGRYVSSEALVDDETGISAMFHSTLTHQELVDFACTRYPVKAAPGKRWVYHTSDTYLAGLAMTEYWRKAAGRADADFFQDVLVDDLYAKLQLSPVIAATRRTRDEFAYPQFGTGLTFIRDDFAKLGAFLAAVGAAPDGTQLVKAARVAAALQRDPKDFGLQTDRTSRYNDSFWARNVQDVLGCKSPVWMTYASGYGGILLAVAPNGFVYYYVSDGEEYANWNLAVRALHAMKPMCQP